VWADRLAKLRRRPTAAPARPVGPTESLPATAAVVLNYRAAEDTLRAVEAVRAGSVVPRLIVVDNGPADDAYRDLLARLGPDVDCLASGENLGYAAGNNIGIRRALDAGAEFVWILNPDTEAEPSALRRLLRTAVARPDAGVLGPRILFPNRRIQFDGGTVDAARFGAPSHLNYGLRAKETPPAAEPIAVDYVNGASMLIRADVLRSVGLLPEDYFLYFEETAYCRDVIAAGWTCLVDQRARVVHHNRSRPGLPTVYYIYYMTRNRLHFAQRYFDADPAAVLADWNTAFLDAWRGRVARDAPDWSATFEAIVHRAVADAASGITGRVPEVELIPHPDDGPEP
jgi:hypothetical protein